MSLHMCGVAGFSRRGEQDGDPSALTRSLIAGLAERGEDACGYAWRTPDGKVGITKAAMPPARFLREIPVVIPRTAQDVLVHVRDHTKGAPADPGNNHPIEYGRIVGVHNGIIQNDEELFAQLGRRRDATGVTVDSEAIFLLLDALPEHRDAFPHLIGSYVTAFFDAADHSILHLVRGRARPLHITVAGGTTTFASTSHALQFAMEHGGLHAAPINAVRAGRHLRIRGGKIVDETSIHVRRFTERTPVSYARNRAEAIEARDHVSQQIRPRSA